MKLTTRIPNGTAFATAIVSCAICGQAVAADNKLQEAIVMLSAGPNLFVDDYLIATSRHLKRTTHQPEKHPDPVFHVTPGNVRYDSDGNRFRMWYIEQGNYALAESTNGIDWRNPEVGLVDAAGTKRNNLIDAPTGGFQGQFLDDGPGAPDRRYKLAFFRHGLRVAFSPDGLRFAELPGNPVIPEHGNDIPPYQPGYTNLISDVINACWDPLRNEYLLVCKVWQGGYAGKPHHAAKGWRRCVGMSTSKDFVAWEKPQIIFRPDPKNGLEEFYSFSPMVRGNLYLGFLRVLRDDLPATPGGPVEGIGWTELVTSRDGRNWTRHQETFIDHDLREGRFDHAMAWYGNSVMVGDKEYIFYSALLSGHKTDRVHGRKTGLAVLRKNGFVSRDAGADGGFLKTHPSVLPGEHLMVNANIRGKMSIRLVDTGGQVISGYDWPDCVDLHGDSVAHQVAWKRNARAPKNKALSLEFKMNDADLYGFDLAD